MREIKFRAWNKEEKVFYFDVQNVCRKRIIGDSMCESFEQVCNSWEFEVNQYTELKDINGKEIYEGDILLSENNKNMIGKVYFENGKIKCIENYSLFDNLFFYSLKVIGNIYENPELLKGDK